MTDTAQLLNNAAAQIADAKAALIAERASAPTQPEQPDERWGRVTFTARQLAAYIGLDVRTLRKRIIQMHIPIAAPGNRGGSRASYSYDDLRIAERMICTHQPSGA